METSIHCAYEVIVANGPIDFNRQQLEIERWVRIDNGSQSVGT